MHYILRYNDQRVRLQQQQIKPKVIFIMFRRSVFASHLKFSFIAFPPFPNVFLQVDEREWKWSRHQMEADNHACSLSPEGQYKIKYTTSHIFFLQLDIKATLENLANCLLSGSPYSYFGISVKKKLISVWAPHKCRLTHEFLVMLKRPQRRYHFFKMLWIHTVT